MDTRRDYNFLSRLDPGREPQFQDTDSPPEPEAPHLHSHTPRELTSPAPPVVHNPFPQTFLHRNLDGASDLLESGWEAVIMTNQREPHSTPARGLESVHLNPKLDRERSTQCLEKAFVDIHRTQALLAYLKILGRDCPEVGAVFEEAKQAYEQGLVHHHQMEFFVAQEYGAASQELSFTVECLTAHFLRRDSGYPTLISPPPERESEARHESKEDGTLNSISNVLARTQECLRSGTLPAEDRSQVAKVVSWSEGYFRKALRSLRSGDWEEGEILAEAAWATARSARHLCKQSYMMHTHES